MQHLYSTNSWGYQPSNVIENSDLNAYYESKVTLSRDEMRRNYRAVMLGPVTRILDRVNELDERFEKKSQALHAGSYWQGLKVDRPDEFDLSVSLKGFSNITFSWVAYTPRYFGFAPRSNPMNGIIEQGNHDQLFGDLKVVRTSQALPSPDTGYTSLDVPHGLEDLYGSTPPRNLEPLSFDGNIIPFLVQRRLQQLVRRAVQDLNLSGIVGVERRVHGPAITLQVQPRNLEYKVSVDLAPMAQPKYHSFPSGANWPHPNTRWPSPEKKRSLALLGVNLVAKKDFDWQISFAEVEKELVEGIDKDRGCRKKTHRIVKMLNQDKWKTCITSYMIKNLWFWECEHFHDSSDWQTDKLAERFKNLVQRLISCLQKGELQQFFHPDINLMKKLSPADRQDAERKIQDFLLRNPNQYLRS